jgi:2-polyprenyl-3-methyl-5-hydroxy-6-metoxy-1,4-benzoquinol methylase
MPSIINDKLTTRQFWTEGNGKTIFKKHDAGHGLDNFIRKYIPRNENGSVLEIGSYPGPHLATFGDLGYTLSGIDFHPDNIMGLPNWLKSEGYKTGTFLNQDFFDFNSSLKYNVVASFGFIEHFSNYKEIILRHARLVQDGGYLMITTPNFRGGIQKWLHRNYDKENLKLHNLESMRPGEWSEILKQEGFEILYKGHFGGFWFWRGNSKLNGFKKLSIAFIERVIPQLRKIFWFQSPSFSAYCGIVARKHANTE